jgi:predicted transcriptional regulator
MKYTPETLGAAVRTIRKKLGVTQRSLALTSGTGLWFIIELGKGKPTCQIGKDPTVLQTIGVSMELKDSDGRNLGA